jgi:cysteinyl-tRNA synthetase
MQLITPPETLQSQRLKRGIRQLIHQHLQESINPYWLISFHYTDNKTQEQEVLKDTQDLKRKLHRLIYQARDKTIKGAGAFPYPKMVFFHENSHQGTGQYHTHLITEAFPSALNTQAAVEHLFSKTLPSKVKALSKWKSIDIQRIHQHDTDYRRISNYLTKQTSPEHLAIDPFSSDLTPTYNRPRDAK